MSHLPLEYLASERKQQHYIDIIDTVSCNENRYVN